MRRLQPTAVVLCLLGAAKPLLAQAATAPLVQEQILAAPPARVWQLLTTAEGWQAMGVAKVEIDLRIFGLIRSHYDKDGVLGDPKTIENTILAYDPERMLALKATKTPAGFPFPAEVIEACWTVMLLQDLGDGRTLLSLRGHGYPDSEAGAAMRKFFAEGNAWTLRQLAQSLEPAAAEPADPLQPIECSVRVPATPMQVFAMLTTKEGYRYFLGVDGVVELSPGGPLELHFDPQAPAGQRGSEGCRFLSYIPGRMISFTWNAPPKYARARQAATTVVVELEGDGPSGTRVRLSHRGFAEHAAAALASGDEALVAEWQGTRAYLAAAWPRVLAKLAAAGR